MNRFHPLMELASFPADAIAYFDGLAKRVEESKSLTTWLRQARERYFEGQAVDAERERLASDLGIHPYTADLLFLLSCSCRLREIYESRGYGEEPFRGVISDLGCKLAECRRIHGIWGIFVFSWFHDFFLCKRFALGRLQYDVGPFSSLNVPELLGEDLPALRVHIPSSGPLTDESVDASLRMAHGFFGFQGKMAVFCSSWMLYPPLYEIFPEGSNLRRFYERFLVISQKERELTADLWRIFPTAETDLDKLIPTTSLQTRLLAYLRQGKSMGTGQGVLLYEPRLRP